MQKSSAILWHTLKQGGAQFICTCQNLLYFLLNVSIFPFTQRQISHHGNQ
jgi:hypothetical protein